MIRFLDDATFIKKEVEELKDTTLAVTEEAMVWAESLHTALKEE